MTSKTLAAALGFGLVLLAAPTARSQANDNWQNAIAIGDGTTGGTTVGATTGSPIGACGSMGNDVWYSYVATCTGTATATTCPPGGATFDTVIATWFPPLACGAPRPGPISCNDDSCALRSSATFAVLSGHTYYVSVGGYGGATGLFTLSMSCSAAAGPPPAHDTCANAAPVNSSSLTAGTNVGATSGAGDPLPAACGAMAKDVWYSFVAPQSGPYVVTTCQPGTDYDTMLAVWSGAACGSLVPLGCSDDDCYLNSPGGGLRSTVHFTAIAGSTYHISVGGYLGGSGVFHLRLAPIGIMNLLMYSSAPGNIGFTLSYGPPNGTYFAAFTLIHGAFPNGWFLGIDIAALDLAQQLLGGASPFWGPLNSCGQAAIGPFTGLPPNLSVYGVAVGFETGGTTPVVISDPESVTVQ
jgi:hypothetical protein